MTSGTLGNAGESGTCDAGFSREIVRERDVKMQVIYRASEF